MIFRAPARRRPMRASSSGWSGRPWILTLSRFDAFSWAKTLCSQHAGALGFLLDQPPDALLDLEECRLQLHGERAPRGQVDVDDRLDAGGPRGEYDHPIGEE